MLFEPAVHRPEALPTDRHLDRGPRLQVLVAVYVPDACFLVGNGRKPADGSFVSADPVPRLLHRG